MVRALGMSVCSHMFMCLYIYLHNRKWVSTGRVHGLWASSSMVCVGDATHRGYFRLAVCMHETRQCYAVYGTGAS